MICTGEFQIDEFESQRLLLKIEMLQQVTIELRTTQIGACCGDLLGFIACRDLITK